MNLQRSLAIVQWYSFFFFFIIRIKFEGDLPPLFIINKCSLWVKPLVWYKKNIFFSICLSLNPFNNTLSCQSNSLTMNVYFASLMVPFQTAGGGMSCSSRLLWFYMLTSSCLQHHSSKASYTHNTIKSG